MAYLIVVLLSLLVGAGVYAATLRAERDRTVAVGFDPRLGAEAYGAPDPSGPGPGYTYLRVGIRGPSWHDRVIGVVGLLILLGIASVALAFGIYQVGHIVNVTVENFLAN
jgi:hypothetical protein